MTLPVLIVGVTSGTPHGRHALGRMVADATVRGIPVVGLDTPDALRGAWRPDGLLDVAAVDWHDNAALAAWADERRGRFAGVLTHRERCVLPTALLAGFLGLPGNHPDAVRAMQDKARCRSMLAGAGLPQPRLLRWDEPVETAAHRVVDALGEGPWVVKPRVGMGSAGVLVVERAGGIAAAISRSRAYGEVLVEQYVNGDEFSCEGVFLGGAPRILSLTAKQIDSRCVETGHRIPAGLAPGVRHELEEALTLAFRTLGVAHGLFHVEFWVGDGLTLGELHARPGGDFIHALVEASRPGLGLFGLLLDDLLGRHPIRIPPQMRAAGSQYLTFPSGVLRQVQNWEEATRGLLAAEMLVGPGAVLSPPLSSEGRHAVIVADGDTLADVEKAFQLAIASLRVEIA